MVTFPGTPLRSERGVAVVVVLFALSIFSVLALTVLRNPQLEVVLRTSEHPDLHVVLYTGGAGTPQVLGRLNLPTLWRSEESVPDLSAEIRAPGPVGTPMTGELAPGLAYAVQLTPGLRVCCDNGDGTCGNMTWDNEVPEGSVSPSLDEPLQTADTERKLQFALSAADIADNVELDPNAIVESPFLVKAARVLPGDQPDHTDGAAVSCRLETRKGNVATGTLRLNPGVDAQRRVNRVSSGSVDLTYREPIKR